MSLNWNLEAIENHKEVCWIETDEKRGTTASRAFAWNRSRRR